MKTSSMPLRAAWLSLLLALSGISSTFAYDPAEGTLDENGTPLSASGGPYPVSNPSGASGDEVCADSSVSCDEFLLTLDVSDAFRNNNKSLGVQFEVTVDSPSGAADLDLYIRDAESGALLGASATEGGHELALINLSDLPRLVRVRVVPFAADGATSTLTIGFAPGVVPGGPDPCEASGEANEGQAQLDPEVRTALAALAPGASFGALVHFNQGTHKQQDSLLARLGLLRKNDFRQYSRAVFVEGPAAAFVELARQPSVAWLEYNRPLRYLGATGPWTTRARVGHEAALAGPYLDAQGQAIDGRGVSLGVIDSGVYGPHPDFAGRLAHNYKLINFVNSDLPQYVDVGTSADTESQVGGHGTHVTGIVGGSGAASTGDYPSAEATPLVRGTFTGAAPGATLIHWGNGAGLFVLSALTAYQHMLANLDSFDPPLRAVNNSYGDDPGTPYNPASTASCLIKEIVKRNVSMVFAASNDGGDGSVDMTSSYCKDPTPGVICVANYDDQGTGTRDGPLNSQSSRSRKGAPEKYVDIAAPGTSITATCFQSQASQAICTGGDELAAETDWQPFYGTISGTSMAAPHITGIVGLLAQARPELTPADIEALLMRTAHKVGPDYEPSPRVSGATVHFGYGAGLVDVAAALDALGVRNSGLPPSGEEHLVLDGDADVATATGGATDVTRLSVQETTEGGLPGLLYRIDVADAADLAAPVSFTVEQNVGGRAAAMGLLLGADGSVSIPEAGVANQAIASRAELAGNQLSAFVPYAALGYPPVKTPIHNLRVVSRTPAGDADYAPSPLAAPVAQAALQPMYGRPFTTQLAPGAPPPSTERSCIAPGITFTTSPAGVTGNGAGLPAEDLRQAWTAEPSDMPGKLVFTLKVAGLDTVPAGYRWYVYFVIGDEETRRFAAMDSSNGAVGYIHGTTSALDTPIGGVGQFSVEGDLDPASGHDADGTIRLVLDKAAFGIETGTTLSALAVSVRQTSPANGTGLTVDSSGSVFPYTVAGNDNCLPPPGESAGTGGTVGGTAGGDPAGGTRDRGRFGSSAVNPALLLPLLALALLRRRRR